jgi:hypothetical protein
MMSMLMSRFYMIIVPVSACTIFLCTCIRKHQHAGDQAEEGKQTKGCVALDFTDGKNA